MKKLLLDLVGSEDTVYRIRRSSCHCRDPVCAAGSGEAVVYEAIMGTIKSNTSRQVTNVVINSGAMI